MSKLESLESFHKDPLENVSNFLENERKMPRRAFLWGLVSIPFIFSSCKFGSDKNDSTNKRSTIDSYAEFYYNESQIIGISSRLFETGSLSVEKELVKELADRVENSITFNQLSSLDQNSFYLLNYGIIAPTIASFNYLGKSHRNLIVSRINTFLTGNLYDNYGFVFEDSLKLNRKSVNLENVLGRTAKNLRELSESLEENKEVEESLWKSYMLIRDVGVVLDALLTSLNVTRDEKVFDEKLEKAVKDLEDTAGPLISVFGLEDAYAILPEANNKEVYVNLIHAEKRLDTLKNIILRHYNSVKNGETESGIVAPYLPFRIKRGIPLLWKEHTIFGNDVEAMYNHLGDVFYTSEDFEFEYLGERIGGKNSIHILPKSTKFELSEFNGQGIQYMSASLNGFNGRFVSGIANNTTKTVENSSYILFIPTDPYILLATIPHGEYSGKINYMKTPNFESELPEGCKWESHKTYKDKIIVCD